MSGPLWFANFAAYSLQVAVMVLAGWLALSLLGLKQPRVVLVYWQILLVTCLLLPLVEPWRRMAPTGGSDLTAVAVRTATSTAGLAARPFPTYEWILMALVAGIALGFLRLGLGLLRLRQYRQTARRMEPLPRALREAQALIGTAPAFYLSGCVGVPVTFGWLHPAVILPDSFERMDENQQRAIACHELLHVAQLDWLMNLFEELILVFFWFHPAVRWVVRRIRLSREQAVDLEVVALTGARQPYLRALLEIATGMRRKPLPAPLLLGESQLTQRVALLLKGVHMSRRRLMTSFVTSSAALLAGAGLAVWAFPLKAPAWTPLAVNSAPSASSPQPTAAPAPEAINDKRKVYKVGGDVTAPVLIVKSEPPYPPEGKRDKVEGVVVLLLTVDASGNVTDVRVKKSLRPDFDENAVKTVRTWKFKPATRKGRPVRVSLSVEITFRFF